MKIRSALAATVAAMIASLAPVSTLAGATYAITNVSAACAGQNAEVEQAADATRGFVYVDWMGCQGIGFARSFDGGRTYQAPITLPGSAASNVNVWDPSVTVAPDGTVYAAS